jgi:hypothetical protein
MKRTKRFAVLVGALLFALPLAGCGNNAGRDVENIPSLDADAYRLINNANHYPNLLVVCYAGIAFVTTTRSTTSDDAVNRVPELDKVCPEWDGQKLAKWR